MHARTHAQGKICKWKLALEAMQANHDTSSPKGVGSRGWSWKMGDWTCQHSIAIKTQFSVHKLYTETREAYTIVTQGLDQQAVPVDRQEPRSCYGSTL